MQQFDVDYVRCQFPALERIVNGHPAAFLDGPGGTQVPQGVLDAVTDYLVATNANTDGMFETSARSDEVVQAAREALADFLGCRWDEIAFGANMTTLTFLLAAALARELRKGDEVVITELDHEGNRGPWLGLAERGIVVREVPLQADTCTLDWDAFAHLVNERTRVVAIGYASNAVGTVNDVKRATKLAKSVGARTVVDAVHFALHGVIDVRDLDCDFLLCSAYKFFAPHVGVLYARRQTAERLPTLRLRTQEDVPPFKFETGTLNHEGIAGAAAAVEFIADMGRHHLPLVADEVDHLAGRRRDIVAGMIAAELHEQPLARRLIDGLSAIPGVAIYGPPSGHPRTSTVAFTLAGRHPHEIARRLGEQGLFVWDGDFYAVRLVELLGLAESGGLVRVGLAPYNTAAEVERVIAAVAELAPS